MNRDEIVKKFVSEWPRKNFRFPDEPKWLSGDEIVSAEGRLRAHKMTLLRRLMSDLGIDPRDDGAVLALVDEVKSHGLNILSQLP